MLYKEYKRELNISKIFNREINESYKLMYNFLKEIDDINKFELNINVYNDFKIFRYKFNGLEVFNITVNLDKIINITIHLGFTVSLYYELINSEFDFFNSTSSFDIFMKDFIKDKFKFEVNGKY